jgi:hypothetical protein
MSEKNIVPKRRDRPYRSIALSFLRPRAEVSTDYWAADKVRMCVIGLAGWNGAQDGSAG